MEKEGRKATGPWIESMILGYGSHDSWPRVKARILGISKPPHLRRELEEKPGHLVFVSDDVVQIPGILTAEAWERLQRMEERESLLSLSNSTVSLCRYSLMFHAEPEESKCQFFVNIDEMISLASGSIRCHVPNCTTLPTVRQKIRETWRALQADHSTPVMDTQAGFCLTDLLTEWQQDRMSSLLKEAAGCLLPPRDPPSPQPSTSHQSPSPTPAPMLHLPQLSTRWDADRVQYKGDDPFTVPTSHLYVPEQQKLLTQPGEDHVTSACGDAPLEEPVADGVGQTDDHEDLGSSLLDDQPANPWDVFGSADMETSSLLPGQGSVTPDNLSLWVPPSAAVPAAASSLPTRTSGGTRKELFMALEDSSKRTATTVPPYSVGTGPPAPSPLSLQRSEDQSLPPYQRPHPSKGREEEEEEERPVARKSCTASRGRQKELEKDAGKEGGSVGGSRARSPLSWLLRTPTCGRMVQDQGPDRTVSRPEPVTVHADGAPFSYTYRPAAQVAEALHSFSIPDNLLQWSVRYLSRHHPQQQLTARPHDGALCTVQLVANTD